MGRAGLPGHACAVRRRAEMDLRAYADGRACPALRHRPRTMLRATTGGQHSLFTFTEPERRAFFGSFGVERDERSSR
jgi:hypothetical protein